MTQQVHQDVNADLCVGQFGGEGMPTMSRAPFARAPSMPALSESAQDAIPQGAAGDAVAVATDEQRCVGGPAGQSPGGGGATREVGESDSSAVEVRSWEGTWFIGPLDERRVSPVDQTDVQPHPVVEFMALR